MQMRTKSIITLAAAALLAGCQHMPGAAFGDDYVRDSAQVVKAADWNAMQTITVEMHEHGYEPANLTFKTGQAYRLVMKNPGEKDHYFTAPEFFKSIATRKAQVAKKAEIKAPYFSALEVIRNGGELELWFVPVKSGKYPVYCTIDDHREKGMDGMIVVQ